MANLQIGADAQGRLTVSGGPLAVGGGTGVMGPTGATGLQGVAGIQGAPGPTGLKGLTGVAGAAGVTGPAGSVGPTGPAADTSSLQTQITSLAARVATLEAGAPPPPTTGWTVFTASLPTGDGATFTGAGTRKIYVDSAAADDTGDGSLANPKKTIYEGSKLLRTGFPDWLLLKKGGSWIESTQMEWSGRSKDELMLISSYGTGPRPLVKTRWDVGAGFISMGNRAGGEFIAVVGLEIYAYDRDPANPAYNAATADNSVSGIVLLNPFTWFLIEDCWIHHFNDNISQDGGAAYPAPTWCHNLIIRRNVITDCYTITHKASGIHTYMVAGLVVEENVLDHNGYLEGVTDPGIYQYNHNIYVSAAAEANPANTIDDSIVFRRNIVTRDASGSQLRTGGYLEDNLWARSPYPFTFPQPNAIASTIKRDVVLEGAGNVGQNFNWGIMAGPGNPPYDKGTVALTDVIVANCLSTSPNSVGIEFSGPAGAVSAVNCIVFNWPPPALTAPAGAVTTGTVLDAAVSNSAGFPDPHRVIGSYHATLGKPATFEAFIAEARKQSKDNWRAEYTSPTVNAYIRGGFGR